MKKEVNKIILFLGFLMAMVGLWLTALNNPSFTALSFTMITVILAFAFVNATNNVLKIVGYSLCGTLGASGIYALLVELSAMYISIGAVLMAVGMILMALAALIYLVAFLLGFFGFVKKNEKGGDNEVSCLWTELGRYKEMQADGILTEDEFVELKQRAMDGSGNQSPSMDDLKKWKKLLDQQVITEEEFGAIKKNIFAK